MDVELTLLRFTQTRRPPKGNPDIEAQCHSQSAVCFQKDPAIRASDATKNRNYSTKIVCTVQIDEQGDKSFSQAI